MCLANSGRKINSLQRERTFAFLSLCSLFKIRNHSLIQQCQGTPWRKGSTCAGYKAAASQLCVMLCDAGAGQPHSSCARPVQAGPGGSLLASALREHERKATRGSKPGSFHVLLFLSASPQGQSPIFTAASDFTSLFFQRSQTWPHRHSSLLRDLVPSSPGPFSELLSFHNSDLFPCSHLKG